jgi:hypothetical protein
MEDVYMDNPRRERAGWLGDMVPEAMGSYYAFGDYRLARHALALFARSQRPDGRVIVRYPSIQGASHPNYISGFVFALRDYVACSGDTTRSQGYGAAPVVHAGKYILGVSPDEPGFRRFSVLPVFAGLPGARGRVPTPLGIIQVEWRQEHNQDAWLDVLVPQGASARIGLPDGSPAAKFLLDGMRVQPDLLTLRRGTCHMTAVGPGRHRLQQVFKQA